ncbi:cupin domain-containing protein [Deinococcus sp. Marseille-Q6407]|uniref:cupin domain-containing protein n=1 Tax=Deinococcus sp. Marseille-Q6407 TaxID=2969223 RepID=UPI0021C0D695|nr:cupin domain-containing protein [Deinococcus sp. Marseille-Q6407]
MTPPDADFYIRQLQLEPHPEGGYYRQVYAGAETPLPDGRRRAQYTSIFFLLRAGFPSHLHRLRSDELWYWHAGAALTLHLLHPGGRYDAVRLGPDLAGGEVLQYAVPAGVIFGSSVEVAGAGPAFGVVSCMVSPGFDFADFELFTQAELLAQFPQQAEVIAQLAYAELP